LQCVFFLSRIFGMILPLFFFLSITVPSCLSVVPISRLSLFPLFLSFLSYSHPHPLICLFPPPRPPPPPSQFSFSGVCLRPAYVISPEVLEGEVAVTSAQQVDMLTVQRCSVLAPRHRHPLPSVLHAETYSLSAEQCSAAACLHRDTGTPCPPSSTLKHTVYQLTIAVQRSACTATPAPAALHPLR
jgi:hypothetical protein